MQSVVFGTIITGFVLWSLIKYQRRDKYKTFTLENTTMLNNKRTLDDDGIVSQVRLVSSQKRTTSNEAQKFLLIYIKPEHAKTIAGADLFHAAIRHGLELSDDGLFHHTIDKRRIFSLAQMAEPGSFQLQDMGQANYPGLLMYMPCGDTPAHREHVHQFLQSAYYIARDCGAKLHDEQHQLLTTESLQHYLGSTNEKAYEVDPA